MRVNRLNPVQKATNFLRKSKVGTNEECTVTVKTATDMIKNLNPKKITTICDLFHIINKV